MAFPWSLGNLSPYRDSPGKAPRSYPCAMPSSTASSTTRSASIGRRSPRCWRTSRESNTFLNIMLRHAPRLRLIVGHSKGALNIANVLPAFLAETELAQERFDDLAIVTLGCGIAVPEPFTRVRQYVGTWDVLGQVNTPHTTMRHDASLTRIPWKGHNLSSINPVHMPAERLIREVWEAGSGPRAEPIV